MLRVECPPVGRSSSFSARPAPPGRPSGTWIGRSSRCCRRTGSRRGMRGQTADAIRPDHGVGRPAAECRQAGWARATAGLRGPPRPVPAARLPRRAAVAVPEPYDRRQRRRGPRTPRRCSRPSGRGSIRRWRAHEEVAVRRVDHHPRPSQLRVAGHRESGGDFRQGALGLRHSSIRVGGGHRWTRQLLGARLRVHRVQLRADDSAGECCACQASHEEERPDARLW